MVSIIGMIGQLEQNNHIGAGSVVTKDIPNDSIAIGNPARIKKK